MSNSRLPASDREPTTPSTVDPAATRLKLRPDGSAELHPAAAQPAPVQPDDLAAYILTPDGASAEFWQLVGLASVRRAYGKRLSCGTYARMRAVIVAAAATHIEARQTA